MSRERTAVVIVVGVLNLAFGVLAGLWGLVNGGFSLFLAFARDAIAGPGELESFAFLDREVPGWVWVGVVHGVVLLLQGLALLVAGGGAFFGQNWARRLTLAAVLLTLPVHVGNAVYEVGWVAPATEKYQLQQLEADDDPTLTPAARQARRDEIREESLWTRFGVVIAAVIPVGFALGMAAALLTPGAAAAFRRRPRPHELEFADGDPS
jgi:hypothetical protein